MYIIIDPTKWYVTCAQTIQLSKGNIERAVTFATMAEARGVIKHAEDMMNEYGNYFGLSIIKKEDYFK